MTEVNYSPEIGDKVRLVLPDDVLIGTVEEEPSRKTRVRVGGEYGYLTWGDDDVLRLEIRGEYRPVECVQESTVGQSDLNDYSGFKKASEL